MKGIALFLVIAALLAACAPVPASEEAATQTLVTFFEYLNQGQFTEADALYGGDYETLTYWNPDLEPSDHAALWKRGCLQNGLQCLTVRSATFKGHHGDT